MRSRRRMARQAAVPARPLRPREAAPTRSMLLMASSPFVLGFVAALAGTAPAHAQAVNLGGANNIVADGRTKTQITVAGTKTSITTGTISGDTGFNSFSDFQQAAGTQVDLYVPDGAGNLLNIVRNGPVVIDGVLNGYKNGKIGGNIYFSDSHGFVVGSNGVVNVGSLTVNTPTSNFLDTVVAPDGTVNDAAAQQLMQGTVPISPDGLISIAGTINAKGDITLQGNDVEVTGGKISLTDAVNHLALFQSTVNISGVSKGGMMVSQGGQIRIVASDQARVGGTLKANAVRTGGKGGTVSVSGQDVTIDGAARLTANGEVEGGGGTIDALAVDSLLVEDGALFSARGAGTGMGGFVELSGKLAEIGAVHVDLGSSNALAGSLLIDPVDLTIDGGNSLVTNGSVTLQADNSITLSSGGSIDTTSAPAGAGTITLESRLITVANGTSIRASAGSDVLLTASVDGNTFSGEADTAITIGSGTGAAPIISGRNVILTATATANTPSLLLALATAHADISITAGTITATDQFKANASASTDATVDFLPVAIVVTDVRSSVEVAGTAHVTAGSAELTAQSSVSSVLQTMSIAPPDTVVDAAATVSTIDSTATVSVDGDANLNITGATNLTATNDITTTAIAEPAIAKLGASVSVSIIDASTSATIGGNASVSSGSLALDASTTTSTTVTAAASESGGGAPQQNSEAKAFLDDPRYSAGTSTSEGGISVVGGFAISDLTSTTLAQIDSTNTVTATGDLSVQSSTSNSSDATADGSAVDSTTGVGVAVAFNLAHVSNDALIESAVEAGSLELSATMVDPDGANHFSATATSGAGASNVGVAGSLATNVIDTESVARIGSTGSVTIDNSGAVTIESADVTDATASATPSSPVSGGKVGIGASVAINIIANRSTAELADNAGLTGAGDVTLSAAGDFTADAEAEAGASGGISITPALGLSLINNATTAQLGTGSTLQADSLDVSAIQQSDTTTSASGEAAGSKAAIGAALALAIVNDDVVATTSRALDTTGDVSFTAMGASFSTLTATASASGGEATADDGSAPPSGDVDTQVGDQFGSAQQKQTESGVGDQSQQDKTSADANDKQGHSASTSEGKLSVAAAVGVNVQTAAVSATIPDNITVNAGGVLKLGTAANTDGQVTADGSAVGADGAQTSQVGIGAAVAVNKISDSNVARLGDATHTLGGLTIEAQKTDIAAFLADPTSTATRADVYLASATSGAGGSKVGIAGSLALNLIDTESSARIAGGANVTITDGGAVSLAAEGEGGVTATAAPTGGGATGGKVGIGVSAAVNVLANRVIAEIADGATVVGLDTNTSTAAAVGDISLSASGTFEATADATAGSEGGVSLTPALGLNLVSNSTTARLGSDSSGNPIWAGSVDISATQDATTTTNASSDAKGEKASVGVALALALVNDDVVATTGRSITSSGDVTFTAMGMSEGSLTVHAGAAGAEGTDDSGNSQDGSSVDDKVDTQLGSAQDKQTASNVGSTDQQAKTNTDVNSEGSKDSRSAKTSEGKLAVAAAVAVNVQDSSVTAVVPDNVVITAGGKLSLTSGNTTGANAAADGSAVNDDGSAAAQVAIGVAAAVNVVDKTNTASLGNAGAGLSHSANGVEIAAGQYVDPGTALPVADDYETSASSGAGGSKVGLAGSLALNLIHADTTAHILGDVDAGSGASVISADQEITAGASATPSGDGSSGGKVGIGASVALNLLTVTTTAELPDNVTFSNGGGLTVSANGVLDTTTEAEAGAGGGIAVDAVVALAILDQTTTARIGIGTGIDTAGDVTISASSSGDNEATANGDVKSGKVGVGAAAAVIVGGGTQVGDLKNTSVTTAELARDVTADSLTISAESDRGYTADATATAGGGKESTETASGGQSTSGDTLQKTQNAQQGTAGGSKISVAAAVGVAAAQDVVSATLGAVTVDVTGDLKVDAGNSTGMATIGSGQAVSPTSKVGVGIGVALGIINNTTTATIADGADITNSGSVEVKTDTAENTTGDFAEKLTANAIAGASSSKVSVAGALAVGISQSSATASIGDNVQISSAGAVNVIADNQSKLSAKSVAGAFSGGNVGVGASVATVVADHSLTANIGANDTVTATDVSVQALDEKFDGLPSIPTFSLDFSSPDTLLDQVKDQAVDNAQHNGLLGNANYYAEAMGGAAAGGTAVDGSFAVMVFSDDVNASIGTSLAATPIATRTTIDASGDVSIEAGNDLVAKALSGGVALGSGTGVGISSSVIVSSGTTTALLGQNAEITNSASFSDTAHTTQDIDAFGVSAAGGGSNGVAGVATVITSDNSVQALLALNTSVVSTGDVTLGASNGFETFSLAGGAAGGGSNGIGAAASVITVDNITRAALADGTGAANAVSIDAGGTVGISADASETGTTYTAAGAAAGSNAVGAGAAVYVLGTTTEALVGAYATIGTDTTTHPDSLALEASDTTELTTVAGAIAGGGTVGGGAGAAVGVVIKTTTASIADNAAIYAGDVSVAATSSEDALTTAVGVGLGGTAGLAGALSVYSVADATTAEIGDATVWSDGNAAVLASDDTAINFISGAAGFSGTAAVGAAASVAIVTTHTHALIDNGASVTALGNGSAVDYVSGYTPTLGGASGDYAAPTPGDYTYAAGPDGEVLTAVEAQRQGLELLALTRSATPVVGSAHGVVVSASGDTSVRSLAIGAGISGTAGIAISANVPVVTTDILASVGDNTSINVDHDTSPNAQQSVVVAAAGDLYRAGLAGSVGGGTVGIGGGIETAIMSPSVRAAIGENADVNAEQDVIVTASGHEDLVGAAAAAGVGVTVGVSGGVTVFSLDSVTTATIKSNATVTADGNVVVAADDITRTGMVVGSLAVGATGAGVGGSIGLSLITKDTEATIADDASVTALGLSGTLTAYSGTGFSATQAAQGVLVTANSNESVFTLSIAGGGGLFAGVAGAVSVQLLDITTLASIGDATINGDNTGAGSGQDVVVVARDSSSVAAIDGGLAIGAGAVAGAVDVGVLRNSTAASISDGATVNASDRVEVAGLQNTDVDSTVISAAGGIVGIAAGISVYSIGDGIDPTGKGNSELSDGDGNSTGSYVQGQLRNSTVNDLLASSSDTNVKTVGTQMATARAGVSVADINTQPAIPAGTSATVGNAAITTGNSGSVTVASIDTLGADATTGAIAGGVVGLGAGVGVITVDTSTSAQMTGTSTVTSGSVAVTATTTHTFDTQSLAGSFGLAAAEASVALITDNAATHASIDGMTIVTPGAISIGASDQRTVTANADGASVGAAAVGVSTAAVNLGGTVTASLGKSGGQGVHFGSSGSRIDSLSLTASSENSSTATAFAASGGIGIAAQGSDAEANTTTQVSALDDAATIYAANDVGMSATSAGRASAEATGYALAGFVAAGGSFAHADVAEQVATHVFDSSLIDAGSITIGASVAPTTATPVVSAEATGSSGAMVGLTATEAKAVNLSGAGTLLEHSALTATGTIALSATTTTSQYANASGLAVGLVAAGANVPQATSDITTTALLSDMTSVQGGGVQLHATGVDTNVADAVSGSGGLVAGSAAAALTSSTSTTRAAADTSAPASKYLISATGGTVDINATHTANFGGQVDSTQASLVGASGATIGHTVNATVDAHLGDDAYVRAANLTIAAHNLVHNYFLGETAGNTSTFNPDDGGWNVDSGSGGLVNLPAGSVAVNLTQNTTATIGNNADVHLLAPTTGVSTLSMEAYNETVSHQKVKLDSGGAIALADTDGEINSIANATTSIGDTGSVVVDVGDVALAAWGNADLGARAAATTYGLAGAPSGRAYTTYDGTNNVTLGQNVRLEASDGIDPTDGTPPSSGTVALNAGTGLDGTPEAIKLATTVDLYNKTAIPISTTPDAQSTVHSNGTVTIGSDDASSTPISGGVYGVNAAGDITLRASRGNIDATAVGTGKDIYREELAKAASAISNVFGGGDVTFDYHGGTVTKDGQGVVNVDGLVDTGLQRHKTITFDYAPNCDTQIAACLASTASYNIKYTTGGPQDVGTDILNRLRELNDLLAQYSSDPVAAGAYRSEINFLQKKLVALGLGTFDGGGVFHTNTYSGPSPRDAALALVAQNQQDIASTNIALSTATGAVVVGDSVKWGTNLAAAYTNAAGQGLDVNEAAVLTTLATLSKYAGLTDATNGNAAFKTLLASIPTTLSAGSTAAASVKTLTADNATHQATIATLTGDIQTLEATLAQAQIDNNTALATSTLATITSKRTQIGTELTAISNNNSQIATQSALAKSKAAQLQTDLTSLITSAEDTSKSADVTAVQGLNGTSGALTNIGHAINGSSAVVNSQTVHIDGIVDINSDLQTFVTGAGTKITTLTASSSTANSIDAYLLQLGNLGTDLATNTQTAATASSASTAPQAFTINVADTAARLGNISIVADQLNGGSDAALKAPGDAAIDITNDTANTLKLGSLLIPTYDAGNIRFNGALVSGNTAINALNPGGTGANFATVETAATSSRPQVTIISNYNPDSTVYYNPASSDTRISASHLPPDIILNSGKTIDNLTGAVNITSAAGNIYINGAINAGSVNILAKNGDFVSSYVNGFDHIGGDPASFNDPTRASEAGTGIIANGAVSISARYLNINSTIQSGIADWTLNLNGTPTLTTATANAGAIGLDQSVVDGKLATYKTELQAATSSANTPSPLIDLGTDPAGNHIYLNMAPEGVDATDLQSKIATYVTAVAAGGTLPNPVVSVKLAADPTKTITVNIKDFLSPQVTGRIEFSKATADAYATANPSVSAVYGVVSPSSNIGVSYNARQGQYEVDGTSVHGGYIQLYGQIMNTAQSGGQLNVLDGFGTINITNTSSIPVVLSTLKTGEDPTGTGRGTAGVIDIMDITGVDTSTPSAPVVNATHTVYTRDYDPTVGGSGQVKEQVQAGYISSTTGEFVDGSNQVLDIADAAKVATGGNRTASYTTTAGQRYVWTTGDDYSTQTFFQTSGTQLFGTSDLTVTSVTSLTATSGPNQTAHRRLADGTYVTVAGGVTQTGIDPIYQGSGGVGIVIDSAVSTKPNTGTGSVINNELVTSQHSYLTYNNLVQTGSDSNCNWWTLCIAQDYTYYYRLDQSYTTITTNSLKADHAIGINFIGSDTGAINVNSSSNVVLTNGVTATNGAVTIKATGTGSSIIEGNLAGQVKSGSADLEAAGSVGDLTWTGDPAAPTNAAIPVNLSGGSLIATAADGNVLITSGNDLKVKQVTAAGSRTAGKGSVDLFTSKSITAADSSSYIEAPRVILTALNGSVGSVADGQQLLVNTAFQYGDTTRSFGDPSVTDPSLGLSVTAGGDIGIKSSAWSGNADGTMLIDQVISLGGNVRLVSAGQILDNNPTETVDQRTYQQLLSYWDTLGLLEGSSENAAKQQAQVTAYENSKTQQYDQYWQIRHMQADGGTTYDPNFAYTLTAQQTAALTPGFEAQVRAANPTYTDQQVADAVTGMLSDYATNQTKLYHELNDAVGVLTASFVDGYHYQASDTEKTSLTSGAGWTERELAFSLSPGALKTVTATNPVLKDPNVSGRTVTLDAQKSIGETVGAGTPTPGVRIPANINPADLTLDQKVALASAERSDLQLDVVYNGTTQHIPLGADFSSLTPDQQAALNAAAAHTIPVADITIVVLGKRPLNFAASTALNVTVHDASSSTIDIGTAYLASRGNGPLGAFSVPGETRVKVIGDLSNAAGGGVISTGNLILEAAQGQIGTAATPMQLALNTGSTFTGRAQGGVDVNFTGDAAIDTVYTPQDVRLSTTGSLLNANNDQLINILGTNVVLDVNGTIGSGGRALNVGNNLGGGITASAGGLINLFGPANSLFDIKSATSTSGSIALTAGFEGIIDGAVSAPGEIDLAAGGRLVISGNAVVQSTAGLVSVDADSLKMINGAAITADIGRVLVTTTHDALVTGITSGSTAQYAVDISAGGHVLAATDPNRAYDIKSMASNAPDVAGVRIVAALGIGGQTEADDKWADGPGDVPGSANAITSVGNALRILSSTVTLNASAGDIYADLLAPKVKLYLTAGTGNVHLDAAGELDIGSITVSKELTLGVNVLTGTITQDPAGPDPLTLTLTGYHGGVGTSADIIVDAPAGLIMPLLRFYDSQIQTTAKFVSLLSAYVPGSLLLDTPLQTIFVNDRSPAPLPGSNAQMYQPNYAFTLNLDNYHTTTNAFVVWYDTTAQVTSLLNGLPVDGASLVRDTTRIMSSGEPLQVLLILTAGPDGEAVQHEFFFDENGHRVVIDGVAYPVGVVGPGPAVKISEAN